MIIADVSVMLTTRTFEMTGTAVSSIIDAEAAVAAQASALKSALDSGDRKGIVDAAGALAKAGKEAADQDIGKKAVTSSKAGVA
jgi:hypothetical protein